MIYYSGPMHRLDPFRTLRAASRSVSTPQPETFPAVNLWQSQDAVAVTAEVPGFTVKDIDITVQDQTLTLSGEREPTSHPDEAKWHRNERRYGKFMRSMGLPFAVDADKVEARLVNGVLQIVLPRPETDKPQRISIKAA